MNKGLKTVILILFVTVTVSSLSGCAVSWVFGGTRFSPEEAMEAVGIGASKQEYIEIEDCRFYYQTTADCFESCGELADWIYGVTPVKKKNRMWSANPNPRSYPAYTDGAEESIVAVIPVEVNGKYHNFLIPDYIGGDTVSLPEAFPRTCTEITVNESKLALFRHSYFVTDEPVSEFEIDGIRFKIGK